MRLKQALTPRTRRAAGVVLLLAMLAGTWWLVRGFPQHFAAIRSSGSSSTSRSGNVNHHSATHQPNGDNAASGRVSPAGKGHQHTGSGSQLSESSWQDPFEPVYWESTNWSFHEKSMRSSAGKPSQATFRRRYKKFGLTLRIVPEAEPGPFEIRLATPKTRSVTTISFTSSAIEVRAESPKQKGLITRRKIEGPMKVGQPMVMQLVATNRFRISWNQHRGITFTRPATQVHRELEITLVSHGKALRISSLRIDGE